MFAYAQKNIKQNINEQIALKGGIKLKKIVFNQQKRNR